jgi:dihydrofolate synthase/folylpolyglutamate synthase
LLYIDATNIITPWACGITNISFDHQAILGATLPLIAREKAGIMKPGVPVVIAPQQPDVCETLVECARSAGAPYEFVGRETVRVRSRPRLGGAQEGARLHPSSPEGDSPAPAFRMGGMQDEWPLPQARLRGLDGCVVEAELGLRGRHQAENWAVAVRLADLFHRRKTGARMPADAVRRGSRLVQWPGRLEEVRANGTRLLLDGAHNDHSLRTVLREMSAYLAPPVVLFACAKDKNSVEMLQVLADAGVKAVVFTHSGNARGREPRELADMWRSQTGRDAPCFASCKEGLKAATHMASANGVLLVTGSLYLVGAVKDALARR